MQSESVTERATRRRNALLALLHQGAQRKDEIIAALEREHHWQYDEADDPEIIARKQLFQFRRDLHVLRLHYKIEYDNKDERYTLIETPFGLALSQKHLAALALVLDTFHQKTIPYATDIQELFAFLMSRLPEEQQRVVVEERRALNIDLSERTDYSALDPAMLTEIERAILRGQQLAFAYKSPSKGQEVRHVIEPQPLRYKDGHVYLHGWSIDYEKELRFRLDYILPGTAKMLRKTVMRTRPRARTYVLCYHLTPIIARNSVSQHFPEQRIDAHADGSATITATIGDLFEARQILLRYGENCTVASPPELLELMLPVATHFQRYLTAGG
jgi:predicted DNA-binding transcriptional regulator YafY